MAYQRSEPQKYVFNQHFLSRFSFLIFFTVATSYLSAQPTPFELGNGNQSTTYQQCIAYYQGLAMANETVSILQYGETDSGHPLHLVVVSQGQGEGINWKNRKEIISDYKQKNKSIFLIMNGIHPGEPDGIDASMMLARDYATKNRKLLKDQVLCIIPIYNIGGALNRNSTTRANQNGPQQYGFRGNAKNLDLNRDFVKGDSKNTHAFWKIFQEWKPDVFVDNHTSNGADYQYTMTLITSQKDKQDAGVKNLSAKFVPILEKKMADAGEEIAPYVNVHGTAMDGEIVAFFESPRYSTGYTSLFGTLSFVAETHMLKPFEDRVKATYTLMEQLIATIGETHFDLKNRDIKTIQSLSSANFRPINWELDREKKTMITFKGYDFEMKNSVIPGQKRVFYDHDKPYTREISYLNSYTVSDSVTNAFAYHIPRGWSEIADIIRENGGLVKMAMKDTSYLMEIQRIESYETTKSPYEGHYLHSETKTTTVMERQQVKAGDFFVILPNRFAIETLEPRAVDAFFAWNFFDPILQQKEWYSSYVFEDTAEKMLSEDAELKKEFDTKRSSDKTFSTSYQGQLYWIYQRSKHFEKAYKRYPIGKILEVCLLPIQ